MSTITQTTLTWTPSKTSNFQQQIILDNQAYTLSINWNLFGCRYYATITDQTGTLVVCRPLIGSPLGYDLLSIESSNNIAVATINGTHTYRVGTVMTLLLSGCTPDEYNGLYQCNILNESQFSFPLVTTSTAATGLGQVQYFMSMTEGYFQSELVYFPDSQQLVILG